MPRNPTPMTILVRSKPADAEKLLSKTLASCQMDLNKTAKTLHVSRPTLVSWAKELGMTDVLSRQPGGSKRIQASAAAKTSSLPRLRRAKRRPARK